MRMLLAPSALLLRYLDILWVHGHGLLDNTDDFLFVSCVVDLPAGATCQDAVANTLAQHLVAVALDCECSHGKRENEEGFLSCHSKGSRETLCHTAGFACQKWLCHPGRIPFRRENLSGQVWARIWAQPQRLPSRTPYRRCEWCLQGTKQSWRLLVYLQGMLHRFCRSPAAGFARVIACEAAAWPPPSHVSVSRASLELWLCLPRRRRQL